MATSQVTLSKSPSWQTWTEVHGTATTRAMTASCTNAEIEFIVATAAPATTAAGHLFIANTPYNVELSGDENLYGRSERATECIKTV